VCCRSTTHPLIQFLPPPCTVHLQTGWVRSLRFNFPKFIYDILQLHWFTSINRSSYYSWYAAMTLTTSLKTSTWIITVVLAKYEIAPWWLFLREPKHVGATVGILIVLIFLWFYICVRQVGRIKKCFATIDARYKHEDNYWRNWNSECIMATECCLKSTDCCPFLFNQSVILTRPKLFQLFIVS
jgi:hypothetical protein